jgi:hypothetical protein
LWLILELELRAVFAWNLLVEDIFVVFNYLFGNKMGRWQQFLLNYCDAIRTRATFLRFSMLFGI